MYSVGQAVELKCKFGNALTTVRGRIMLRPNWCKPTQLAIATGNPDFPMAVVDTSYVVSSKKSEAKTNSSRIFSVKSGDKQYTVQIDAGKFHCNCVGFGFRQHCKHVTAVAEKLQVGVDMR